MDFIDGKRLSTNLDSLPLSKQKAICKKIGENIAKLHDADIIHGDLTTSNMILVEDKEKDGKNYIELVNNKSQGAFKLKGFEGEQELLSLDVKDKKIVNNQSHEVSELKTSGGMGEEEGFKVYFIDFGLGFISKKIEDKAVDLHLLRQALGAKHFKNWKDSFEKVLQGYSTSKNSAAVLEQFKKVEKRGRYKEQY